MRYYITLGAATTAGGKVISASDADTIDGVGQAREGDKVSCPCCGSEGVIALDGPRLSETIDGREVALNDDLCICKCSPPPRLVATQTFYRQLIDAQWLESETAAAAKVAAGLNSLEESSPGLDRVPLILRDLDTKEPFRQRPYRLQLANRVIEGRTDHNGATEPLSAAERRSVLAWHIGGDSPA